VTHAPDMSVMGEAASYQEHAGIAGGGSNDRQKLQRRVILVSKLLRGLVNQLWRCGVEIRA
jgi:hypothetical protein